MPRSYTYGPFQSRRLGLSLGINILSNYKICTYDCVYCEIGKTDQLVSPRFRIKLPPSPSFRRELKDILKYVPHLKSLSFTGYYGEPTLNANLLDYLKITLKVREEINWTANKPIITLFTNSSTLYLGEIRNEVKQFELILAKLDAATLGDFQRTNNPHQETSDINTIIESLVKLKKEIPNGHKLAIQSLIYNSYREDFIPNSNDINITNLAKAIKKIKPNSVQIYSVARIPANYYVFSIDKEKRKEIVDKIKDIVSDDNVEISFY